MNTQSHTTKHTRRQATHDLKCWPKYFDQILNGAKTFELRKDDRGFQVGDKLLIREYEPSIGFTGDMVVRYVTYVMREGFGLRKGWVCMALCLSLKGGSNTCGC